MAETKKRNVHSPEFKGNVGLEAVRGIKTVNEIAQHHGTVKFTKMKENLHRKVGKIRFLAHGIDRFKASKL